MFFPCCSTSFLSTPLILNGALGSCPINTSWFGFENNLYHGVSLRPLHVPPNNNKSKLFKNCISRRSPVVRNLYPLMSKKFHKDLLRKSVFFRSCSLLRD